MTMIVGMASDAAVILAADSQDSGKMESLTTGINTARKIIQLNDSMAVAVAGSARLNDEVSITALRWVNCLAFDTDHLQTIFSGLSHASVQEDITVMRDRLRPYTDAEHPLQLIIGSGCPSRIFAVRLPEGNVDGIRSRRGYRFTMAGSGADLMQQYAPGWVNLLMCGPPEVKGDQGMMEMAVAAISAAIKIEQWEGKTSYLQGPITALRWNAQGMNWHSFVFSCNMRARKPE